MAKLQKATNRTYLEKKKAHSQNTRWKQATIIAWVSICVIGDCSYNTRIISLIILPNKCPTPFKISE